MKRGEFTEEKPLLFDINHIYNDKNNLVEL